MGLLNPHFSHRHKKRRLIAYLFVDAKVLLTNALFSRSHPLRHLAPKEGDDSRLNKDSHPKGKQGQSLNSHRRTKSLFIVGLAF